MIQELVSLLFFSRDYAHRAHLKTTSFAQHVALDTFYKDLPEHIDRLVEAYQGRHGLLDIPYIAEVQADVNMPLVVLTEHLAVIEGVRVQAIPPTDSALNNILDEIVALYLSTLYKLRFLR